MTQPGRAAIEIVGDASKLGPQLERDAQRAIDRVEIDTDNLSKQIGDGFRKGADEAIGAFDDMDAHFARTSRSIRRESDGMFDGIGRAAQGAGDDVRTNFLRPLMSGFSRLGETISSAGSALVGFALTGTNPAGLLSLAVTAGAIGAALPVILGVAAALADLVGIVTLLPAAIGGLASVLIVTTVAFQGFGDAISAVLDGDPEKIAEAMERLAPAAQVVVREFQRVLPIFRDVGKEIQQGFFVQLNTILERFGTGTLPRVRDELRHLSGALGNALAGMASLLLETENVGILERLFESTSRSVDTLGNAFYALGQAFLNAIDAGLPSLETLTDRLAGAIESFAGFINASIEDGSFQEFLDDAIATLDELLALGGAVGELLGVLFGGTDDAGRGFLGTLTDITQRMTEFFKSAEGQDTLADFSEIIVAAGIALGAAANAVVFLIDLFADLDDAVNAVNGWLMQLGADIVDAWNAVVEAVSSAVDSIGRFFSDTGDDAASWWDGVTQTVSDAVDTVIAFVSALPGRIVEFVQSIPGRVVAIFDLMVDGIITTLAVATATVIVFFTDLPGQVTGALVALLAVARETFEGIYQSVLDSFNRVIAFVQSVPGLLAVAWAFIVQQVTTTFNNIRDNIVTTWENILAFFSELPGRIGTFFQGVVDAASNRVSALIENVKGIPGRVMSAIGDLGRLLYDSGAKIIQGLIDGIGSRLGQLRDKIAGAVQTIRDHLPFSPAKTGPLSGSGSPQIAGAVIAEMIAAGLDAGTPLISQAAGRAANATTSPFGAIGQAGVTPLTSPLAGQSGTVLSPTSTRADEQMVIVVNIDGEELTAIIDRRVDTAVSTEVRRLLAGTRGI